MDRKVLVNPNPILPLLFILFIATLLRFWIYNFELGFIDSDPFYHARISENIFSEGKIPDWDSRELGGIPYYYPPFYHILNVISKFFINLNFLKIGSLLTVYCADLSILTLYVLCKRLFNQQIALLSAFLFAVNPALVYRTGLFARPTGLTILLLILLTFSYVNLSENSPSNFILFFMIATSFLFTHSFALFFLFILFIFALITRNNFKEISLVLVFSFLIYLLYFFKFIGYLHPHSGYTIEYASLFYFKSFYSIFFTLFTFYLLFCFPFLVYGVFKMYQLKNYLFTYFVLIGIISLFFMMKITIFFIFSFCLAISIALFDLLKQEDSKMRLFVIFSISVIILNPFAINGILHDHFKPLNKEANLIREILSSTSFSPNDTILSNDWDIGHVIVYYTDANTFLSDLTDTKKWQENIKVHEKLMTPGLSVRDARNILRENDITYLLLSNDYRQFPFVEHNKTKYFELIAEKKGYGYRFELYRVL